MGLILGIDFGTSNTVICSGDSSSARADNIKCVFNEPTIVAINKQDNTYFCGYEATAKRNFLDIDKYDVYKYFKARIKSGIAPEYERLIVSYLTYALNKTGKMIVDSVESIIITLPTEWTKVKNREMEHRRTLLRNLLKSAIARVDPQWKSKFEGADREIRGESEAAAESINSLMRSNSSESDKFMLLIDCGGGTIDFSIFETNINGKARWADDNYIEISTRMGNDDADFGKAGVKVDFETVKNVLGFDNLERLDEAKLKWFKNSVHELEGSKLSESLTKNTKACLDASGSLYDGKGAAVRVDDEIVAEFKFNGSLKKVTFKDMLSAFKSVVIDGEGGMKALINKIKLDLEKYGKNLHNCGRIELNSEGIMMKLWEDERYFRVCLVGGFSNSVIMQKFVKDAFGITASNNPRRWWEPKSENWSRDEAIAQGAVIYGTTAVIVPENVYISAIADGKEKQIILFKINEKLILTEGETDFCNGKIFKLRVCVNKPNEKCYLKTDSGGLKQFELFEHMYDGSGKLKGVNVSSGLIDIDLAAKFTLDHKIVLSISIGGLCVNEINLGNVF